MIGLFWMPLSIATFVWRGRQSTARRRSLSVRWRRSRIRCPVGYGGPQDPSGGRLSPQDISLSPMETCKAPLRIYLGAFGDPGHAFPMLALGTRLAQRGHEVTFETWSRWRDAVRAAGMQFVPAPEYPVFPTRDRPLNPYEAVALATEETIQTLRPADPQVVVHDILTMAPALAGELHGAPVATLIPHVNPVVSPGFPPYAFGARMPDTPVGRGIWHVLARPIGAGLRRG